MTPQTRSKILFASFVTLLVPMVTLAWQSGSTIAPSKIFEAIGAKEGITVCEMGAGDGELTIAAAKVVGAGGHVYSSELGEDRVKALREKVTASGLAQITVVAGDPVKTNFPDATCDALFMRNVYHHFSDPGKIDAAIAASLKPGARVAVIDFTPPDKEADRPEDRGKDGMHGVMPETVSRELKQAGLEQVSSETGSQRWFMIVAAKPKS
jgi:ubiquinone/menaquinone biosynthesis C-methylase UbiE